MKLIKGVEMVLPDRIMKGSILFSENIEDIQVSGKDMGKNIKVDDLDEIDGSGLYLTPGFIDIHIHGAGGCDTMDADSGAINKISKEIIKSGVTSFLPTTMTMAEDDIRTALNNIKKAKNGGAEGARVLGANVEGPFINKNYKGAQKADYIIEPENKLLDEFLDIIKMVTVAPEIKGSREFINYLNDHQKVVSAGHSGATYEEVMEARNYGLSHITHLFNAMTGLHHRKPGIVGAALESDFSCELIADFIHIHPAVFNIIFKTKNLNQLVLITDQMRAGSMGDGIYSLGKQKVIVKDNAARLEDGQLAGSVLTLDKAVRNIKSLNKLTLPQIIAMATINPARVLGLDDQLGKIATGYRADLVLMDRDLNVKRVFRDGEEL